MSIEPYYEEPGIVIYHGEAVDILPHLPDVDLMACDPPYGLGEATKENWSRRGSYRGKLAEPTDYGDDDWDDKTVDAELMTLALSKGEHAAIWGGNFYVLPPTPSWLVWDKEINGDFADVELCWTNYGCAARLKRHMWNGMLRKGREPRVHPTQKPVDVMAWVIGLCPGDPKTVLDPFMGSGTTLVAAKQMGLHAIGIEREEKYCAAAVDRLRQGVLFGPGQL